MVVMTTPRQPAMRRPPGGTRGDGRPDLGPDQRSVSMRALSRTWAIIRWGVLIVGVAVGVASVIAIALAAMFTLVDSSL